MTNLFTALIGITQAESIPPTEVQMSRSKGQGERLNATEGELIICEWG